MGHFVAEGAPIQTLWEGTEEQQEVRQVCGPQPFSQRGAVSWHEWEFMDKHGQPHGIQRSQLPHLQGPQELVICRAVTGLVGKVLILSFWKTS